MAMGLSVMERFFVQALLTVVRGVVTKRKQARPPKRRPKRQRRPPNKRRVRRRNMSRMVARPRRLRDREGWALLATSLAA